MASEFQGPAMERCLQRQRTTSSCSGQEDAQDRQSEKHKGSEQRVAGAMTPVSAVS